ncbi:MAG: protein kinase [Pyrinomonadaceae bacterium]|nr:protein kinase [Pyrinomonadaceae bacterium]
MTDKISIKRMSHRLDKSPNAENPEFLDEMIGQTFGVYRITGEIGRGGMGVVYLAERADGVFRQDVAIKFVKRGMDTDSILKRFRNERQILASLNHPNVALLYDGGTTDKGLPYFVMEYVAGEPLYQYCDRSKLNIRERLKIFIQVCEAVHAAHQIKVVHRDLKPSNILVKADGTPKLLDFGIAKLLDPELSDITIDPTATQMRMMTPEYASPEQVIGGEITFASDIYSLGVLLYELLSGHRPYRLKNRSPYEVARVICEESPESLSESLNSKESFLEKSEVQTLEKVLETRGSDLFELRQELSGELEQIVMNALHKKAEDRYQTALELAEDVTLYLKGKPIKKKYSPQTSSTKNNKPSLAVLPLKIISGHVSEDTGDQYLSVGLVDALVTRLSRVGRLIMRPTSSILRYSNHENPFEVGRELGVEFIVDGNIRFVGNRIRVTAQLLNIKDHSTHWAESFDEQFTDVLEVEDSLAEKIGQSLISKLTGEEERQLGRRGTNSVQAYEAYLKGRFYWNLQTEEGFARAIQYYQQAVQLDPNYALAYAAIAEYYIFIGIHCVIPFAQGSSAAKQAAERAIQIDPTLAEGYAALGFAAIGFELDWEKSERLFLQAIELNPNSITANFWYIAVLTQSRRFDKSIEQLKIVLELDPGSLLAEHMVAWVLYHSRRYEESSAAYLKMLKDAPNYAWGLQTYSWALRQLGNYSEAIHYAQKAVDVTGENPMYLTALAAAYADAGELGKTWEIMAQLDEIAKTRFVSEYMMALVYCALGDKDKAFEYLEKSLAARDGWMNWLGVEPQLDILRTDPRYEDLLRRSGLLLAKTPDSANNKKPKSIAVLPLKLFGTHTEDEEYLSLGLTDALVTRLSNVQRLTVRPTSSVLPFQSSAESPFSAGETLKVEYVVDGNIRRVGERVRVSLQLLDIIKGSTAWAENFDEKFTDVLELEDVISERVVKVLLPKLTGEERRRLEKRGTNNVEAYQAYLRGRYFANQFSGESLLKSIECYRQAIQFDANYALPHVGIADFYVWSAVFGELPAHEAYPKAKTEIEQALNIDDSLGEAYAIKAFITLLYDWNWAEAERLVKRSLELNPNFGFAHECYSNFFSTQGIVDEAVLEIKRAEELDPLSPRAKLMTAWTFCITRRFSESIAKSSEANNMQENFAQGLLHLGYAQIHNGQIKEAIKNLRRATEAWVGGAMPKFMLCFALAADNNYEDARKVLAEIKSLGEKGYLKPYYLGMAYAAVGENDLAFEWFEKSLEARDEWMIWFGVDASLDKLRKDPRYLDILRRTNNPIYVKQTKESEPITAERAKSIAVLPLKAFSIGSSEDEYLSLGLTDALITRLSNVQRLTVRPTSSVLQFQAQTVNPFSAGRDLKVEYVVDGNIRRVGEMIRVSIQLLRLADEKSVWAKSFDEKLTDVLELEDSISEQVTKALIPRLTTTEQRKLSRRETNNAEAYQAYLRGRYFWNSFTPETFPRALESFEKAVELDPEYALAYVGIADYYNWATIFGFYTPRVGYQKTKGAVLRALEIDDQLAEAIAVLAFITAFSEYNWAEAERLIKRSLELNPNYSLTHEWYAAMLAGTGRNDEAYQEIMASLGLDPLSLRAVTLTAWTLYQIRRYPEALAKAEEILMMNPTYYQGFFQRGNVLSEIGRVEEAIEAGRRGMALAPNLGYMYYKTCFALASLNRYEEAWELLREFEAISPSPEIDSYHLGMCYAAVGERETAFKWLNQAVEDRHPWNVWLATDAKLDALRDDERFNELMRKSNRPHLVRKVSAPKKLDSSQTLAVLPLKVNSLSKEGDTEERFLGVGLTDALITRLSKTKELIVRPTSSILRFEETKDAFAAGRELDVKFVLNGSIRRIGERVRVSVQLLDIEQNSTNWAENFDEKYTDILELEDSISEQVTIALIPQLTTGEKHRISRRETDNLQAHEAYLRGRYHWNQFTAESLLKASNAFETAVKLDPNYALPYVGLADYYIWANIYGLIPSKEANAEAEKYARKAVELDENLGEAYATLGLISHNRKNWAEAEKIKLKAIKLAPNYVHAREWYSAQLRGLGRDVEADREILLTEQLDPLSRRTKTQVAWIFYQGHKFKETFRRGQEIIELDKNYPTGYMQIAVALWGMKRFDEALPHFRKFNELIPDSILPVYLLCFGLVKAGEIEEARQVLEKLKNESQTNYVKPYFLAMAYTALGNFDEAVPLFQQSIDEDCPWMMWFATEPMLADFRKDSRFQELFAQMKHPK